MKKIFERITNNKLLLVIIIILQIGIIILLINPFSIIAQNKLNSILSTVVTLSNDPDFRNASVLQVTSANTFKNEYLLSDKYSALQDNDYVLVVNDKFIIYRSSQNKIVYQGAAPTSILDSTRLGSLISQEAVNNKLIKDNEQPAVKIYSEETDKNNFDAYFTNLKNGDILAFFTKNQIVVLYNLENGQIEGSRRFDLASN